VGEVDGGDVEDGGEGSGVLEVDGFAGDAASEVGDGELDGGTVFERWDFEGVWAGGGIRRSRSLRSAAG
jgi:hypothetical protein